MSSYRNSINPIMVISLLILSVGGLIWANYQFVRPISGQDEFTTVWVSANLYLMKGISPYDDRVAQQISTLVNHEQPPSQGSAAPPRFTSPFFAIIFFAPFSLIEIHLARALWMTLIEVCFVLIISMCVSLSGWKLKYWLFGLVVLGSIAWYNGAHSIYLGQFSVITLFLMVGSVWLMFRGNDEGAGFLLALSLSKPELSLFVVIFILMWSISTRRTRLTLSFLAGFAFFIIISTILMPGWFIQWASAIYNTAGHPDWYGSALSRLSFALPGVKKPLFVVLHISFGIFLLIEWLFTMKKNVRYFYWAWLLTMTLSVLIVPRSDTSATIMVLPVAIQLAKVWQERWSKSGAIFSWLMAALMIGESWGFVFSANQRVITEPIVLYVLPPLIGFFVLLWIRYWVIRPARLPLEIYKDL